MVCIAQSDESQMNQFLPYYIGGGLSEKSARRPDVCDHSRDSLFKRAFKTSQ